MIPQAGNFFSRLRIIFPVRRMSSAGSCLIKNLFSIIIIIINITTLMNCKGKLLADQTCSSWKDNLHQRCDCSRSVSMRATVTKSLVQLRLPKLLVPIFLVRLPFSSGSAGRLGASYHRRTVSHSSLDSGRHQRPDHAS